jgi:hypothetical protein
VQSVAGERLLADESKRTAPAPPLELPIFTFSHVTQPLEFDKYIDLRQHYFGALSPKSTTVPVPRLARPDFLVQVEAFAQTR